jgi:hypothetical protein
MKFIHLLPVLGLAAAFGAAHALSGSSSHALAKPASPAQASVVPPWLAAPPLDNLPEAEVPEAEPNTDEYVDDEDPYSYVGLVPPPEVHVQKLERSRASNGRTVEEVYAGRLKLAGQRLRVRGTVVKLNEGILGKTYLHLRDGSGGADRGDDDLTATTTEPFELGETVELEGELAIDQDVGAGYVYAALLTQAARVAP